jgi:hypothetical protein
MVKKLTYRKLGEVLNSLGYTPEKVQPDQVAFRNPGRPLFILLPRQDPRAQVRPLDLLRVRNTLVNDGVIAEDQFDSLFQIQKGDRLIWTEPTTGKRIEVTAAAGESDGLVIIHHHGALLPCPVEQVRKEDPAVSGDGL